MFPWYKFISPMIRRTRDLTPKWRCPITRAVPQEQCPGSHYGNWVQNSSQNTFLCQFSSSLNVTVRYRLTFVVTLLLLAMHIEEGKTCNHMDRPWGHYAKWNKSDIERQTLYVISPVCGIENKRKKKKSKLIQKRSDSCSPEADSTGRSNWRQMVKRYKHRVIR